MKKVWKEFYFPNGNAVIRKNYLLTIVGSFVLMCLSVFISDYLQWIVNFRPKNIIIVGLSCISTISGGIFVLFFASYLAAFRKHTVSWFLILSCIALTILTGVQESVIPKAGIFSVKNRIEGTVQAFEWVGSSSEYTDRGYFWFKKNGELLYYSDRHGKKKIDLNSAPSSKGIWRVKDKNDIVLNYDSNGKKISITAELRDGGNRSMNVSGYVPETMKDFYTDIAKNGNSNSLWSTTTKCKINESDVGYDYSGDNFYTHITLVSFGKR